MDPVVHDPRRVGINIAHGDLNLIEVRDFVKVHSVYRLPPPRTQLFRAAHSPPAPYLILWLLSKSQKQTSSVPQAEILTQCFLLTGTIVNLTAVQVLDLIVKC